MSGGHFYYDQFKLENIAEELETLVENNNKVDDFGDCYCYAPETITFFEETIQKLNKLSENVHKIDFMVCGDILEKDLIKYIKESK